MRSERSFQLLLAVCAVIAVQGTALARGNIVGIHEMGLGYSQEQIDWSRNLCGTGGYVTSWSTTPDFANRCYASGLYPVYRIQTGNQGGDRIPDVNWTINTVRYIMQNISAQYQGLPIYFQIWNEPNVAIEWPGGPNPTEYGNYLVSCYNGIKGLGYANAKVIGPACAPGDHEPGFIHDMITNVPASIWAFDYWASHPYPAAYPPKYNIHDGTALLQDGLCIDSYLRELDCLHRHGRSGVKVLCTEGGYYLGGDMFDEGWPRPTQSMRGTLQVDAYQNYYRKWPEMICLTAFELCSSSWFSFNYVLPGSGSDGNGYPTSRWPIYDSVAAMAKLPQEAPYDGAGGHIVGYVRESGTNNAIAYATVTTPDYAQGCASMSDGYYDTGVLPAGTYTISAEKMGWGTVSQSNVVVQNGQNTVVNLSLPYTGGRPMVVLNIPKPGATVGDTGTEWGQTFVAPANSGCVTHASIYIGPSTGDYRFFIKQGGPTGVQIGPDAIGNIPLGNESTCGDWADGAVPIQAGQTYYLGVRRVDDGSFYAFCRSGNYYASGGAYKNSTAVPDWDLITVEFGKTQIIGALGTISGYVRDTSNNPISGATVSTNVGGYTTTSLADGTYTLSNVTPGTYNVTASKTGYTPQTNTGVVVTSGQTTTSNFNLTPQTNLLLNGDFEGGFTSGRANNWTTWTSAWSNPITWADSTNPVHGGSHAQKWGRSDNQRVHGGICQAVSVVAGHQYKISGWIRFTSTEPLTWAEVGYDLTGQTSSGEAGTVTYTKLESGGQNIWLYYEQTVTATGSSLSMFVKFGHYYEAGAGPAWAYADDARIEELTPTTGTISGFVKDTNNNAISGATVQTNTGGYSTTSQADGSYTLSNVTPATYNVTASKTGWISQTNNGVVVTGGQATNSNFTLRIAIEDFTSMPSWSSSYNAAWGSAATWSVVAGGQSGNYLRASRSSQGSSVKAKVYTVPANTSITISLYMKCPSNAGTYWIESAYKLGSYTAQDFDQNGGTWTLIQKFDNDGGTSWPNGNGNTWVKYSATVNTGSNTQISIGYKHGAYGGTGPTVGWDTFRIE